MSTTWYLYDSYNGIYDKNNTITTDNILNFIYKFQVIFRYQVKLT